MAGTLRGDDVSSWAAAPGAVLFEYLGSSQMRVLGPVTGVMYEFSAPGASAWVDGRDAQYLDAVPNLRAAAG